MKIELEPEEIEALVEGLDCLKTKIAFVKGPKAAEKNEKLKKLEALEKRLLGGEGVPTVTPP
jgi:hypothetical protein